MYSELYNIISDRDGNIDKIGKRVILSSLFTKST